MQDWHERHERAHLTIVATAHLLSQREVGHRPLPLKEFGKRIDEVKVDHAIGWIWLAEESIPETLQAETIALDIRSLLHRTMSSPADCAVAAESKTSSDSGINLLSGQDKITE